MRVPLYRNPLVYPTSNALARFRDLGLFMVLAVLLASGALADQLVFYAFTNNANPNPASAVGTGMTASTAANGSLSAFRPGDTANAGTGYGVPVLNLAPASGATSADLAPNFNSYYELTLSAKPGYLFTATNISFNAARGGSSTARGVSVRSSLDGYSSYVVRVDAIATQRPAWSGYSSNLPAAFQSISTATLRFYIHCPSSGNQLDMNNLKIEGFVSITTPPATPGLVGLPGNNQALLNWNAVEVATSYNIKRSASPGGPYSTIATSVTTTNYTDGTAMNGTTYYYVVSAVNGVGEGADSSEVSVTPSSAPSVPTGLVATPGDAQVGLTWNASSGDFPPNTYNVKRSQVNGGPYSLIASGVSGTSYTDLGLTNAVTYYYVVSAVNSTSAQSANSAPASATPVGAPPVPSGLSGVAVGIGTELITWSGSFGATSYTVKRSDTSSGPYTTLQSGIASSSFADTNLVNGARRYYYVVSATGPNGTSADSGELSVSPPVLQFDFDFEDVANSITTTDKTSGVTLNLRDGNYTALDLHGAPGSGVAGNGRALDLSALPFHSAPVPDGRVAAAEVDGALNFGTVPNFTVAFWLKPDTGFTSPLNANSGTNNPRLFVFGPATASSDQSVPGMGIRAVTYSAGPVTNGINAYLNNNGSGNNSFVTKAGDWTFVAMTYDRTNVTLYTGSPESTVAAFSVSGTVANQIIDFATAGNLYIGNQQNMQKGIDGWYDNFRFYTGAADSNFLENVRWSTVGPVNLAATPGNSQVVLNWRALAGATNYTVKRSTTSGGAYMTIAAGVLTTNYTDNTAVTGTTYYYTVSGLGALGESLNANEIMATPTPPPSVPMNLLATAGDAQVTLSWNASTGVALPITYNVRRSFVSGGPYVSIATNEVSTGFIDTGLTNGITCYYVVSAINANLVESGNSAQASATPVGAPPVPTGLSGRAVGIGTEVVSWSPSFGATSYTVKRSATSGGPYTVLSASLTTNSYTDTALVNGTRRLYYVVSATGANGTSLDSAELSVTPPVLQMRFEFEDVANSISTTDLVSGVTLNLVDGSGFGADLHGPAGSGVLGNGRALDFSSNPYSSPASGPLASVIGDPALGFGTVSNCTVTLWVKADSDFFDPVAIANNFNNPRAFMLGATATDIQQSGVSLKINSVVTNGIQPYVNSQTVAYGGFISPPQAWRFVAISYDGATVNVYYGSTNAPASLLGSYSCTEAINFGSAGNLLIGNRQSLDKSVDGWFDDVRFYTGTLDLPAVEAVRAELAPLAPFPVVSLSASLSGTNVLLSFPSQSGFNYQIERRGSLAGESWGGLGTAIPGDGATKVVSDGVSTNQFYRLLIAR